MGVLFYKHNEQESKLNQLSFLLGKYNLSAHDDDNARSERLQAVVNHLETMNLTPSLCEWVEHDLTQHLSYYGLNYDLDEKINIISSNN